MADSERDAGAERAAEVEPRDGLARRAAAFVARLAGLHAAFVALRADPGGHLLPLDDREADRR
jgi:hypothetical protein